MNSFTTPGSAAARFAAFIRARAIEQRLRNADIAFYGHLARADTNAPFWILYAR